MSLNAHPGEALRRKLLCSVRPKCHPLLLDHYLNTRHSILLNVYQVFLLTAYKFHTYIKELPRGRSCLQLKITLRYSVCKKFRESHLFLAAGKRLDLIRIKYLSNPFTEEKGQNQTVITNIGKILA